MTKTKPNTRRQARDKDDVYVKDPNSPRRFKSSYMFFSTQMHPELRAEMVKTGASEKVSHFECLDF